MADFVLNDAYVKINTVDLSDHVESVTLSLDVESIDDTCMADTSRAFLPGLKNGTLSVTFKQDFAASEVDATLAGVYSGGAAVAAAYITITFVIQRRKVFRKGSVAHR